MNKTITPLSLEEFVALCRTPRRISSHFAWFRRISPDFAYTLPHFDLTSQRVACAVDCREPKVIRTVMIADTSSPDFILFILLIL